jgi:hypothetical protein
MGESPNEGDVANSEYVGESKSAFEVRCIVPSLVAIVSVGGYGKYVVGGVFVA